VIWFVCVVVKVFSSCVIILGYKGLVCAVENFFCLLWAGFLLGLGVVFGFVGVFWSVWCALVCCLAWRFMLPNVTIAT